VLTQSDASVVDSLPSIAVPVLVIVGEKDKPFLAGSSYMAEKIPDAELVVIPGAGHAPNVTHTAEFDARLRTFLDRLEVSR
jgi:pimeloyl-ACP methyl ester carboxylesterase